MAPPGASTLTATHRVVHRVHRNASHVGPFTSPARAPGFSEGNIFMVDVADLADGGLALNRDHAHLARGHAKSGVLSFTGYELALVPAERANWPPLPGRISILCTTVPSGRFGQVKAIAGFDVRFADPSCIGRRP